MKSELPIDMLANTINNIREMEQQIKDSKEYIDAIVHDIAAECESDEELWAIMKYLYWNVELVKARTITNILSLRDNNDIHRVLGSESEFTCSDCGK